jgi:hypothetical protein
VLLAGFLVLTASEPSDAKKVTLAAADTGYIESDEPTPEGRILVRFDLPEAVLAGEVELAVLELRAPVTADEGVSCVVVDAFPLTTAWDSATVSWGGTWTVPGGDFDRMKHAVWVARPGEDAILRFDVTDVVAGWASGTTASHGVILAVSFGWPGALEACEAQGAEPAVPTLLVCYTPRAEVDR